jgi:hypothetical protein
MAACLPLCGLNAEKWRLKDILGKRNTKFHKVGTKDTEKRRGEFGTWRVWDLESLRLGDLAILCGLCGFFFAGFAVK